MIALVKFAPWLAAVLVLLGLGGWGGYKVAQPRYNRLQGQYEAFQLTVATDRAAQQKAAADALAAQIKTRTQTEARNAQLEQFLRMAQATAVARDTEFARRLLAAARKATPAPGRDPMPASQGGSRPDGATGSPGDGSAPDLPGLTAAAATECHDAIQRLTALQLELQPQLGAP